MAHRSTCLTTSTPAGPASRTPSHPPPPPPTGPWEPIGSGRVWGRIRSALANVSAAAEGEKHRALLNEARIVGGLAAQVDAPDAVLVEMLMSALPRTVKDWDAARQTALDGLKSGRDAPLQMEDRPHKHANGAAHPDGAAQTETPGPGANGGEAPPGEYLWPPLDRSLATATPDSAPGLPLDDVFTAPVAGWIRTAADAAGAPVDYVAAALLAAAGGCIGNARWGSPKRGWAEPPVVNVALVGRPSAAKSPALDQLVAPLQAIEAQLNEDWPERRRQHATDKAAAEERRGTWRAKVKESANAGDAPPTQPANADEPAPPQKRRLMSTDPTVAKAERMSSANARGLLLVRDELAGWVAGMDRFGAPGCGSYQAFWLQAYGGRPWSPDRVKDGDAEVFVRNLTWSVVGGIQPDRLASLLLAGDDDGLAARFLYVWPEPRLPRWTEAGVGLERGQAWLSRLRTLPWTPPAPLLLPFTRAAQHVLQEWREDVAGMEEGATGLYLSWLGKLAGFAVRIATILAHLEWVSGSDPADLPEAIGDDALLRAVIFLVDYAVPMARRTFGEAALPQAERDARQLTRWLLRRGPQPPTVNVREMRRMEDGPGIGDAPRLIAALEELAGLGSRSQRRDVAVTPRDVNATTGRSIRHCGAAMVWRDRLRERLRESPADRDPSAKSANSANSGSQRPTVASADRCTPATPPRVANPSSLKAIGSTDTIGRGASTGRASESDRSGERCAPPPEQATPPGELTAAALAGYLRAARMRPPSWSDPAALPSAGCLCSCCAGQSWWCEVDAPRGWRCSTCHPPLGLRPDQVREVSTCARP